MYLCLPAKHYSKRSSWSYILTNRQENYNDYTRWSCRHASLDAIACTFDSILETLESISDGDDKQKAIEAASLLHHVHSFSFISCLIILSRIMSFTKILSDQLQSEHLDLASACELILSTIDTLKELRSDEGWEHTFKYISDVAALHNIDPEERRYRKRRQQCTDTPTGHRESLNSSHSQ